MTTTYQGRRVFPLLVAVLALVLGTAFAGSFARTGAAQEADTPTASARFVHVYSGGGPIDVYADDQLVVENIAFGTATDFAVLPEGDRSIAIVATGGDVSEALVTTDITLEENQIYNVLIGGQEDELDARVFEVDQEVLEAGQARVRFIQGEPGAGPVNIQLTAPSDEESVAVDDEDGDAVPGGGTDTEFPAFDNVGIDTGNDYQTVNSGTYGMVVTTDEDDSQRINLPDIEVSAGNVYDIVVLGQLDTNNLTLLPLATTISAGCTEILGVGEAGDACARLLHFSPDAGAVDVYVDGQQIGTELEYGAVSSFTALSGEEHQIQITAAGGSADQAVLDETITFDGSRAYNLAVLGIAEEDDDDGNDLRLAQMEIDLSPVAMGEARIRAIHALPGAGDVTITDIGGQELAGGLGFGDSSDYQTVTAGEFGIIALDEDNNELVNASGLTVNEGTIYDAFVVGDANDPATIEVVLVETPAAVLEGSQGTPIAVPEGAEASPPASVEASPVTGEGEQASPTTVDEAPVTPVLTPEPTATP
ncbi:MAG: DUF4397 domain-containing protein [Chloroflexota bacterium]|nr:DUF4397 domain-containing protein [Chloroflexota bacterium]